MIWTRIIQSLYFVPNVHDINLEFRRESDAVKYKLPHIPDKILLMDWSEKLASSETTTKTLKKEYLINTITVERCFCFLLDIKIHATNHLESEARTILKY